MDYKEIVKRQNEIKNQIKDLPNGYLTKKVISGKTYHYLQWSENGKKLSKYIPEKDLKQVSNSIELRKKLQEDLSELEDLKGSIVGGDKNSSVDTRTQMYLMHKNKQVALIEISDLHGYITKVIEVYEEKHLPVGVKNDRMIRQTLDDWWTERSIPLSRSGIKEVLDKLHIETPQMLLTKCNGLSLSDQYWICYPGRDTNWNDINFFDNNFSEDIGKIIFGEKRNSNNLNFASPDITSDGNLKKRWRIIDGKRCLIKGGSNPFKQEPFNEVIASEIMDRLGIPCIKYYVDWFNNIPYSVCEDFVNNETELIPAWRIFLHKKKRNNISPYQHFISCCEDLGIKGAVDFLDRMFIIDFIILNEDRHLNNFGVLRNAETLEWIGFAPIYDSGSSLGYNKVPFEIYSGEGVECKPFKNRHIDQLDLVKSLDWLDLSKLDDVDQIIERAFSDPKAANFIDEKRVKAIKDTVKSRILYLKKYTKQS